MFNFAPLWAIIGSYLGSKCVRQGTFKIKSPVAFTSPWEATVPAGPAGGEQIHLMWSVYAIRSSIDGRIYVGMSQDVARRISEHNRRKVFSTKGYVPWMLIYMEEIGDRISARKREKYLKSGVGKEFLKLNPL